MDTHKLIPYPNLIAIFYCLIKNNKWHCVVFYYFFHVSVLPGHGVCCSAQLNPFNTTVKMKWMNYMVQCVTRTTNSLSFRWGSSCKQGNFLFMKFYCSFFIPCVLLPHPPQNNAKYSNHHHIMLRNTSQGTRVKLKKWKENFFYISPHQPPRDDNDTFLCFSSLKLNQLLFVYSFALFNWQTFSPAGAHKIFN